MGDTRIQRRFAEALEAGARRDYRTAVALLEEICAGTDQMPEARLYLGRARHALGEYSVAIGEFRSYLATRPSSVAGRLFVGRSYLAASMPKHALRYLREAAELRPGEATIQALLGVALLKNRRSAEAVEALRAAVELAPANKRIYRAYLNALLVRGLKIARGEDPDLAARMLEFAVENGLDLVLARLELGRLYRASGDYRAALHHYERAVAMAPNDPELRWYRASTLMASGDIAAAKDELAFLRSIGIEVPELAWNSELIDGFLIRTLYEAGEWKRLGSACSEWLRRRGSTPLIHAFYSEALHRQGRLDLAENHARRAIERAPSEPDLHYGLIGILWDQKNSSGLRAALQAAKRCGCDRAVLDRFSALLDAETSDDLPKIIESLCKAIRDSGPIPQLMFALARAYLRSGLSDLAESWYRKTLRLDPMHEEASLGLIAAIESQAIAEGKQNAKRLFLAYRDYLAAFPDNLKILREFALWLVKQSMFSDAVVRLEALLGWEPQNLTLRRLLAYAYRKTGHFREAAILLRDILRSRPKETRILLELSYCLSKSKALDYAEALLRKALPLFHKNGDIPLALATILLKRKKKEEALELLRESAARSPNDSRALRKMETVYRASGSEEMAQRYAMEASNREKKADKERID